LKIAIVYSTKGGTTRECAQLLSRELGNSTVELFELGKGEPELTEYDICVLGFHIRMGKADKRARAYMKAHADDLKSMKAAYFICCGFVDCFDEYAEKSIPKALRENAVTVACLGGSLDYERFKGFDRFIVKAVRAEILGGGENADQRQDMSLPTIMEENISIKSSFCTPR
jgi:menaquinone-dependent protoporphyrinogen oxidase